ncbi:9557_t:CDS:2 [Racocetra fulgida]|uniref:9557_t:CDS:1 n=1 Tax=Racocetra fulgida TaxID=60492 RepID=A0A9N8W9W5_9GLOM|nr:9557_t:CDS:2 [Racocetra fulgida]
MSETFRNWIKKDWATRNISNLIVGVSALLIVATRLTRYVSQREKEKSYIDSLESQANKLPIVSLLRSDPTFEEVRNPYDNVAPERRSHHFTAGTLQGKGKYAIRHIVFFSTEKMELVAISHIGSDMCGHEGIVHAYLHINFRKPLGANQFVVGKCKVTKLEGRKGFVEGTLETLEGQTVADGNALFLSKHAKCNVFRPPRDVDHLKF